MDIQLKKDFYALLDIISKDGVTHKVHILAIELHERMSSYPGICWNAHLYSRYCCLDRLLTRIGRSPKRCVTR